MLISRVRAVALLTLTAASLGLLAASPAIALTGPQVANQQYGYPYPNSPDCNEYGSGGCVADAWLFFQGQCTSWVSYRLNQMNGFAFSNYYGGSGRWGDASGWGGHAGALGIAVNGTPSLGSVAWYSSGHVAYVEQVNSPTSVVISEMNYDLHNGFRLRTISPGNGWPNGFIHIRDRSPSTPPPTPDIDHDGIPDSSDQCPNAPGVAPTGCPPSLGVPFDANRDGRMDLAHRWDLGVNTWISKGDGTWDLRGASAWGGYGYGQGLWLPVDVNGDGRTDLAHRWDQGVNTWISNGDGTYAIQGVVRPGYGFEQGTWLVGDIDGDGKSDLVHRWNQGLNGWISNGDGTWDVHGGGDGGAGYAWNDGTWVAGDVNGDGRTDMIHRWSGGVNTWLSNGDGTFNWIRGYQAWPDYGYAQGNWLVADLNGDGKADLVHRWEHGLNSWISNGDGSYSIKGTENNGYGFGQGTWMSGDVNGDGKTDMIHRWDLGVNTWLAKGDGTWDLKGTSAWAGYGYGQGNWLSADVNNDGKTDVIHRWDQGVNTWISNGNGTYAINGIQNTGYGFGQGTWPASVPSMNLLRRPPAVPVAPSPGAGNPSQAVSPVTATKKPGSAPSGKSSGPRRATKSLRCMTARSRVTMARARMKAARTRARRAHHRGKAQRVYRTRVKQYKTALRLRTQRC